LSNNDGVIRIGRKGTKKFAFGEDGEPFEVDVVVVMRDWFDIDDEFRELDPDVLDDDGRPMRVVPRDAAKAYNNAVMEFATKLAPEGSGPESTGEALDFLARLREQYDELADFFQPRKRGEGRSPASSGVALQFSEEEEPSPTSTN
jgi:hypothetical protein